MNDKDRLALKRVDLLEGVGDDVVGELEPQLRVRAFEAGQSVVEFKDDTHEVFFILEGRLRVTLFSPSGKEVAFRDLNPGDSFGELAAIDGHKRSASVIALTPARLAIIGSRQFVEVLHRRPELAMTTLKKLTRLVRLLSERVYEFSEPVPVRVCAELARIGRSHMISDRVARIIPPPKHADIASRINTHREAVSRTMSDLQRKRLLKRGRGELIVTDLRRLAELAAGDSDEI